ncbi:MAG: serine hydrolase domain-containing protein [Gemmatimonadales bacterium]
MNTQRHGRAGTTMVTLAGLTMACATETPPASDAAVAAMPPAVFTDPARREKLLAAVPAMDSLFVAFMEQRRVPGIAWGLLVDGELVHVGTAGLRELATSTPVTRETVFRIASMTKSYTALAILRLRDEGRLSLDDPAERYVPELRGLAYPTGDSPRITIRHLLSHATGFPEDNPWGDQQLDATDEAMSAMMRGGIPFSNPPGLYYEYSNYGFAILGRIVANVSGMSYPEYLRAEILDPLGLTATTLEAGEVPTDRLAHGYRWEDEQWKEEPPLPDGAFGPMGGMLTTIDELGRYVAFLMNAWPPRDDPDTGPVRRASVREMQQVARPRPARVLEADSTGRVELNAGGYGYGLGISQSCGLGHVVAHSGGLPGYGSQMRWLPEYGVGIIALGNLTYTGWGGVISQALDLLAATGALQPRVPQPSAALVEAREAVTRLVNSWDDALADSIAAMNLFRDEAKARRQAQIVGLRTEVGPCEPVGPFAVENALRGRWRLRCERGGLEVGITLAPTMPPKVQLLMVRRADPDQPIAVVQMCPQQ